MRKYPTLIIPFLSNFTVAKIILTVLFSSFCAVAKPQCVSLSKSEIQLLKNLSKTDSNVKVLISKFKEEANSALNDLPNPIDTIISEGHLANDPKKIRTQASLRDMDKVYALAITSRIDKNKKHLKKCSEFIIAWATVNQSTGNPINDTKLDKILEAYDLIRGKVSNKERAVIDNWLIQIATAEISHPRFHSSNRSAYNNWNSHRIKVVTSIAYILNKEQFKQFADTAIRIQISKNLYADGSGFDFEERDALHYHIYTLEPLLKAAMVIKRATGENLFTYMPASGSSIKKSVDFLVPFATGERKHAEFVNSKTAFDKKRADNKEPGYTIGAAFNRETAVETLTLAAYFEPKYQDISKMIVSQSRLDNNWQAVLNAVKK